MPTSACDTCGGTTCLCDVKVCNCARCQHPLTTDISAIGRRLVIGEQVFHLKRLAGKYDDRPYCERCLPEDRSQAEVAAQFYGSRTPRQMAKWGSTAC